MVDSIETPDDYTVVFKLDQPLADFPLMVAAWSWVYPSELVEDDTRQEVAIGTGPFIQESGRGRKAPLPVTRTTGARTTWGGSCRTWTACTPSSRTTRTHSEPGFTTHNFLDYYARDHDDMEALFADLRETMVGTVTPGLVVRT
jgi:hypothetical protein